MLSTQVFLFVLLTTFCCRTMAAPVSASSTFPVTPVVGILTQPRGTPNNAVPNETTTTEFYVAASYVKWLEVAGARTIPIPYDAPIDMVDDIFFQINGLLLPGGSNNELPPVAKRLWQLAVHANEHPDQDYFPIWATCLGFEYVIMLASSSSSSSIIQTGFDAENISLPLHLVNKDSSSSSQLYGTDSTIRNIVRTENVTTNNHVRGIDPTVFYNDVGLTDMFDVTSINYDRNGRSFVSTIEPKNSTLHPFYAVQYHPEKNIFEYATTVVDHDDSSTTATPVAYENINHSPNAIYVSAYLAQFFGRLLRKSTMQSNPRRKHVYTNPDDYPLVYSYPMKTNGLDFEQSFVIPSARSKQQDTNNENAIVVKRNNNNASNDDGKAPSLRGSL